MITIMAIFCISCRNEIAGFVIKVFFQPSAKFVLKVFLFLIGAKQLDVE